MIHFPSFACSLDLAAQTRLEDKLGGLPWGLPLEKWPFCEKCVKPMTLVLQMQHHPVRLNLGQSDRVLLVFQCDWQQVHISRDWDQTYETRVFVKDGQELGSGLTYPPEPGAPVFPEARVTGWSTGAPGLPPPPEIGIAEPPLPKSWWNRLMRRPKPAPPPPLSDKPKPRWETYLGGPLIWLRDPPEVPSNFRFLGQLTARMRFPGPMPSSVRGHKDRLPTTFHGRFEVAAQGWAGDNSWECFIYRPFNSWADGLGYLFLEEPERNRGVLAWQWSNVLSARAPKLSDPFKHLT